MKKYWYYYKNLVVSFAEHRFRAFIWFLSDTLNCLILPFVWLGVFGTRSSVLGYSPRDIIVYSILLALLNSTVISHIENEIARLIRNGEISNYFIKPISFFKVTFLIESNYRLITAITVGLGLIIVPAILLSGFRPDLFQLNLSVLETMFFILSCLIAFLLCFMMTYTIGILNFWFTENSGLADLYWIAFTIFSGEFGPLIFFPNWLSMIANFLPFKYIIYFPIQIYLSKLDLTTVLLGIGMQLMWLLLAYLVAHHLWQLGIKKYQAYGN